MIQRIRAGVLAGLLLVLSATPVSLGAGASSAESQPARPVVKASAKQLTEGSRFTLTATIESPGKATRATLQQWVVPLYLSTPHWESVKTLKTHGKRKVVFKRIATDENQERYRVGVTYGTGRHALGKPVYSKSVAVAVWRWIPLSDYAPYYEAQPYATVFGTTTINGIPYRGWGAAYYSHAGAWESRFTPGRHCKAFRAVLGVDDISADGSSAVIAFTADGASLYDSPTLTPGMSLRTRLPLARPYRFGIQLTDTSPGGTSGHDDVESWPGLGEPAFLCRGI